MCVQKHCRSALHLVSDDLRNKMTAMVTSSCAGVEHGAVIGGEAGQPRDKFANVSYLQSTESALAAPHNAHPIQRGLKSPLKSIDRSFLSMFINIIKLNFSCMLLAAILFPLRQPDPR